MRVSDSSMGGDADEAAKIEAGNRALIAAEGRLGRVKVGSAGSAEGPSKEAGSAQQEARTCPVCGTKFFATADSGFCPVCVLGGATSGETAATPEPGPASGWGGSAEEADGGSEVRRFEHYEVILDDNGRPIELGRGATGITYKAFDVDLRCPVTLKVIRERYVPRH